MSADVGHARPADEAVEGTSANIMNLGISAKAVPLSGYRLDVSRTRTVETPSPPGVVREPGIPESSPSSPFGVKLLLGDVECVVTSRDDHHAAACRCTVYA